MAKTSYTNLQIIAQEQYIIIEDPVDAANAKKIFFPFFIDDQMHCFLSLLLPSSDIDQVLPFFPSLPGQELLIKKDMYMAPFDDHTKPFRNNPKTSSKSVNYIAWFKKIEPERKD